MEQSHHDSVLIRTRILVLIANDRRVSDSEGACDDGIAHQQLCHARRQNLVAILRAPGPGCDISREAKAAMVGCADLRNHAIDCADFNMPAETRGALGEDTARRMRVGDDEQPSGRRPSDFPRISCALVRLAASGGGLDHNKPRRRAQRRCNRRVAHVLRSDRLASPTASRTALQNGSNRGRKLGQRPSANILSASSRPPAMVLNQAWLWLL